MGLLLVLVLLAIYFVSLRGANASTAASTLRLALPHRHAHERGGAIALVPGVRLRRGQALGLEVAAAVHAVGCIRIIS